MAPSARPVMVSSAKLLNRNAKSTAVPSRYGGGCGRGRSRPQPVVCARPTSSLDRRRVGCVQLAVLDRVRVDHRLLDVTLAVKRDRATLAGAGVGADERV